MSQKVINGFESNSSGMRELWPRIKLLDFGTDLGLSLDPGWIILVYTLKWRDMAFDTLNRIT